MPSDYANGGGISALIFRAPRGTNYVWMLMVNKTLVKGRCVGIVTYLGITFKTNENYVGNVKILKDTGAH